MSVCTKWTNSYYMCMDDTLDRKEASSLELPSLQPFDIYEHEV